MLKKGFLTNLQHYDLSQFLTNSCTVGATKSGRDLPLYEIVVLLKVGGTGSYYACLLHHLNILSQR